MNLRVRVASCKGKKWNSKLERSGMAGPRRKACSGEGLKY